MTKNYTLKKHIMKFNFLKTVGAAMLTLCLSVLWTASYAQDIGKMKITLDEKNTSVKEILEMDPELKKTEHGALKREMQRFVDEQMKNMTL